MIALACLALCACVRIHVPPTTSPVAYAGPRTRGYPTPLLARVQADDAGEVSVVARGSLEDVARAYVEAWETDGWTMTPGGTLGQTAVFAATRRGEARHLILSPVGAASESGILVTILPGR